MLLRIALLVALQIFGNVNNPSLDTTAPTVTITSPTSSTTYDAGTSTSVSMSGTATDASGVAICRATNASTGLTANATTAANGSWSITVSLNVGSNAITVTCLDPGNNSGTDVLTVTRSSASSNTFYVRTDGNNANTGTTNTTGGAWRTIDWAADHVTAGATVRVQAGTYAERVTPGVDGSSGNTITFAADGAVTVCGWDTTNADYQRVIGFTFDTNATGCTINAAAVSLGGTNTFLEFWNNTFRDALYNGIRMGGTVCNNCIFFGNVALNMGIFTDPGSGTAFNINGTNNLAAYNDISAIDPDCFSWSGTDGLLLNNYCHGMLELVGAHPDLLQNANDTVAYSRLLIEGNFKLGAGTANDHGTNLQSNVANTEILWRRNVLARLGSGGIGVPANAPGFTFFRYVNNTDVLNCLTVSNTACFTMYGAGINNTRGFNNVLYQAWSPSVSTNLDVFDVTGSSLFDYNLGYDPDGTVSFIAPFSTQAHPRLNVNPNFASVSTNDFTLAAGSGDGANARGTGGPLTTTTNSGTGVTFNVATNTGGFFRGDQTNISQYGGQLVKGDTICVGTDVVEVSSISGDAITVTSSFTWASGENVYFGDDCSPDIGAFPYKASGYTLTATYVDSGTTVTITPNDTSLVRFVVCYSDGIPYAVDNASPYTCSTPTGNFSAKAYKLFASQAPMWVDATQGSAPAFAVANKCTFNGDGSSSACAASAGAAGAFNNLQSALTAATAGYTITVYGPESGNSDYVTSNGTGYTTATGFAFANSGTSGNPITLKNAAGEHPVLRPCVSSETSLTNCDRPTLTANNKQYITVTSDSCPSAGPGVPGFHVYGLVIFYDDGGASESTLALGNEISCVEVERGYTSVEDGNWSGVWVQGQNGVTVRHNYIHDITTAGMTNTGTSNTTSSATGIKTFLAPNAIIRNNTINHVIPAQAGGVDCKADCVNVQIYENDIRDVSICVRVENQETSGGPYTSSGASAVVVRNNLCVSAASSVRGAIRLEDGIIAGLSIYNNTFVNFLEVIEEVHRSAVRTCTGILFYNNALYGTTDTHIHMSDGVGNSCTLTLSDYNYFGTAASIPRFRYADSSYDALSNFTTTSFDMHSTETAEANYLFTNVSSGIYTLQAGSPLQGAGKVGGVIAGAAIDVGAYTDAVTCLGYNCP